MTQTTTSTAHQFTTGLFAPVFFCSPDKIGLTAQHFVLIGCSHQSIIFLQTKISMQLLVNEGGASQNTDSGSVVIAYQKDDDLCRRGIRDIKSRSSGKNLFASISIIFSAQKSFYSVIGSSNLRF